VVIGYGLATLFIALVTLLRWLLARHPEWAWAARFGWRGAGEAAGLAGAEAGLAGAEAGVAGAETGVAVTGDAAGSVAAR
jgi:hypothetical protein